MADPAEGVAADGTIRTGAHRDRVPAAFEPVLADAVGFAAVSGASVYVYGSVANGTARHGSSDVDLLSIGLADAAVLGEHLSVIEAVTAAMTTLQPVRLIAGTAGAEGVAANRRDPAGPVDHEATFLALVSADGDRAGEVVATIVNFACHPTILDAQTRSYSADFPGAARQAIQVLCGGQCVYLQGAAGDINPVRAEPSAAETRRTGAILGAAVARELLLSTRSLGRAQVINPSTGSERTVTVPARGRLIQPAPLRARLTEVAVEPRNHPPLAAIRAAHAAATDPARRTELALEEYIATRTGFGSFDFPGRSPTLPVQAFRLGDGLSVAGLPGEPFTATGQQIRAAASGTVLLAGYANQAAGYLPPRHEFERSGLEVGCSTYAPGTAELLADAATDLLRSFTP